MKKILLFVLCLMLFALPASAYQMQSQREMGTMDARNQNVVVRCTTTAGKVSPQTCQLRRYAKCTTVSGKKNCPNGAWQPWSDIRNPGRKYSDWRQAATACCQQKGLR